MIGYYHRSPEYADLYQEAQILVARGSPEALLSKPINQWTRYSAASLLNMSDPHGDINIFNHHQSVPSLALSSVEVPTLALFGDEDLEVTAGSAAEELEWLAGSNLHIGTGLVRGADHQFHGQLDKVSAMLQAWLDN
jgi:pimeloyl-ACP methyl ester carboxylesterase